jgi:LacI family transcriptional regulator
VEVSFLADENVKIVIISASWEAHVPLAIAAMRALEDAGRSVPEHCSVIGIDGLEMSEYTNPRLTTLRQPMEQMGRESVETLVNLIEGRSGHAQITVEASLVKGNSVCEI